MQSALGKLACLAGVAAMAATPALADKARNLSFINGKSAQEGERDLRNRGFRHVTGHRKTGGFVYSYWWDEKDDDCVVVEVASRSNRIMSVNDAKDQDCGHHDGISGGEAAAIGVGAALLGALIAGGKSHHKDGQDYDERQTSQFDRGYRDGLHNAPYHNNSRSDAYSHGYEEGSNERFANLQYHGNRHHYGSGYTEKVNFADLQGARAAGADSTLTQRGFRNVDGFKSGTTAYTIWSRPQTNQCLQMTVAEGRVYDIRDIGRHPNCTSGGSGAAYDTSPARYNDLLGDRGPDARKTLADRGFTRVSRFGDDNTRYSIMWRKPSRQCLQLMIVDGRVEDVRDIGRHPNCR